LIQVDHYGNILGRASNMLLPLLLVNLEDGAEVRQLIFVSNFLEPLVAILLHELVFVEVKIVLGLLLQLLLRE